MFKVAFALKARGLIKESSILKKRSTLGKVMAFIKGGPRRMTSKYLEIKTKLKPLLKEIKRSKVVPSVGSKKPYKYVERQGSLMAEALSRAVKEGQ